MDMISSDIFPELTKYKLVFKNFSQFFQGDEGQKMDSQKW